MHSKLLTYNAPAGTSAPWSFLHRECTIEKENLIVLWSDDDDDDNNNNNDDNDDDNDCCDSGSAG